MQYLGLVPILGMREVINHGRQECFGHNADTQQYGHLTHVEHGRVRRRGPPPPPPQKKKKKQKFKKKKKNLEKLVEKWY